MTSSVLQHLLDIRHRRGAGYLPLLDPDRLAPDELEARAQRCVAAGADAILIGTSLMFSSRNAICFERVRAKVDVPVISFPGSSGQVVPTADAILFLSLVSGRNPELLIGEHVKAAPLIREYGIETIPTGYMLVESGTLTSVEFMSDTRPIPRDKIDIAMAHALAAGVLGHAAYLPRDRQRRVRCCARRNGERGSRLRLGAGRRRWRHSRPRGGAGQGGGRCGLRRHGQRRRR